MTSTTARPEGWDCITPLSLPVKWFSVLVMTVSRLGVLSVPCSEGVSSFGNLTGC